MPLPDIAFFRGSLADDPDALVFLAAGPDALEGIVRLEGRTLVLGSGPVGDRRPTLLFDPTALPAEALALRLPVCHAELLPGYQGLPWSGEDQGGLAGEPECRTAVVAVETDHEFLGLFGGDLSAAAGYAATLIAASSEIFSRDAGLQFQVGFLRLWETPDDPWNQGNTYDQLFEYRDHWAVNMTDVQRSTAHFLSGRGLGGGIAWLPGTCSNDFGYALSANLGGSFPYPLQDNNGQNWDVMVVTHEFGHNFGAPHTHSMDPPIDGCGNGDCTDANLGTVMSYCHTCAGGMSNVQLKFAPGTIETILAHLASEGAACIPAAPQPVTVGDAADTLEGEPIALDVLANDLAAACDDLSLLDFDAITSGGGTVGLCAGCGPDGRDTLVFEPAPGFVGDDTFSYEVAGALGGSAIGQVTVSVIALRPPTAVVAPTPGAVASYYELVDPFVLPDFSALAAYAGEIVPLVNYPSTGGAFAGSGRADLVGALFEGFLDVPASGLYTLFTDSDDGSRLWIGDTLVVENDGLHGMLERSGTVALAAGTHPVRVEFFERFGGAGLIVRIAGPDLPKQVVPPGMWLHGGVPDLDGDGQVDGADLGLLLAAWGTSDPAADLDGSGLVDGADLGLPLSGWTG